MEKILKAGHADFDAGGMDRLKGDAAVLAYLARDIAANPPAEAKDPGYAELLERLVKSVDALSQAAASGDAAKAKAAIGGLKPAYSRFFLKFG